MKDSTMTFFLNKKKLKTQEDGTCSQTDRIYMLKTAMFL